jgi:hypothetical protein
MYRSRNRVRNRVVTGSSLFVRVRVTVNVLIVCYITIAGLVRYSEELCVTITLVFNFNRISNPNADRHNS